MDCTICHRPFNRKRQPSCPSCARATLYTPRIEQASALLAREKAHTHAEAILRPGNDGVLAALPEDADFESIQAGIVSHGHERAKAELQATEAKIESITAKAAELRGRCEEYRIYAAKLKAENARRKEKVAKELEEMREKHVQAVEPVQYAIKKAKGMIERRQARIIEAREYICKVAGSLSRMRKTKIKDGPSRYWLGGLPMLNLKDVNGTNGRMRPETVELSGVDRPLHESHEIISASLDNVCRLLGVVCHYLAIRLPAEIVLPFNERTHASILPVSSSYKSAGVSFSKTPSSASQVLQRNELSRPRLLHLDRPMAQLLKDDPKAEAFFRDGIVLLAYNIAWLCRSQGMPIGNSFDEICDTGRNLYELLPRLDDRKRPNLMRNLTSATNKTNEPSQPQSSAPRPGSHSHGSTTHYLAGHEGNAIFGPTSDWDISITKLNDRLKSYLRHETQKAEWDFIETTEWDDELDEERPVFVGGARRERDVKGAAMSVMTVKPSDDVGQDYAVRGDDGAKGRSGWMKVRGRSEET